MLVTVDYVIPLILDIISGPNDRTTMNTELSTTTLRTTSTVTASTSTQTFGALGGGKYPRITGHCLVSFLN